MSHFRNPENDRMIKLNSPKHMYLYFHGIVDKEGNDLGRVQKVVKPKVEEPKVESKIEEPKVETNFDEPKVEAEESFSLDDEWSSALTSIFSHEEKKDEKPIEQEMKEVEKPVTKGPSIFVKGKLVE